MALKTITYVAGTLAEFQLPDHTQLLIATFPDSIKLCLVETTGSPGDLIWELPFPAGLKLDQASELAKNTLDLTLRSIGECETLQDIKKRLSTTTAPLLSHYLMNNGPGSASATTEGNASTDHSAAVEDSVAIESDPNLEATEQLKGRAAIEGYIGPAEAATRDESAAAGQSADVDDSGPVEEDAASEHRGTSDGTPDIGRSAAMEEGDLDLNALLEEGDEVDQALWIPPVVDLTPYGKRPRGLRIPLPRLSIPRLSIPRLSIPRLSIPRLSKAWLTAPLIFALLIFALAFPWHILASMKLEDTLVLSDGDRPYSLDINPLTNSVTIRVNDAAGISLALLGAGYEDVSLNSPIGLPLLEAELARRARRAFDAHAMVFPYTVVLESEEMAAPDQGEASARLAAPTAEADEPEVSESGPGEDAEVGAQGDVGPTSEPADGPGEDAEVDARGDVGPVSEPAEVLSIKLALVSRQRLTGTVGRAQTSPIRVLVTDQLGRPVEDHPVNFAVAEGRGSVVSGSVLTDGRGMAEEFWTLGPQAGEQRLVVRTALPDGEWLTQAIYATATPGPPFSRELLLSDSIELVVNHRLSLADKLRVADRYGNTIDLGSLDFALSVPEGLIVEDKTTLWAPSEMRGTFVVRLHPSLEADRIYFRSYYDVTQHPWRYVIAERSCEAGSQADSTHIERNGLIAKYMRHSPAGFPLPGRAIAFRYPDVRREITWWADGQVDTVGVIEELKGSRLLAKQHKHNALYLNSRWQKFSVVSQTPWTYFQRLEGSCRDGSRFFQSRKFIATP